MTNKLTTYLNLFLSFCIIATLLILPNQAGAAAGKVLPISISSSQGNLHEVAGNASRNSENSIQESTTFTVTQTVEPPNGYERPVIVVNTYSISQDTISPGDSFTLFVTLYNAGQHYAMNIVANFTAGDLIPRETGGVVAVGEIAPGNHKEFGQPFILSPELWASVASLNMLVTYTDEAGFAYSDTFVISLPVFHPYYSAATSTPTPTVTLLPSLRPQLVITGYASDVVPLQPGAQFNLSLTVKNMGSATAKRVTMIVGGGSISGGDGGTQQPGGISGASGEFTNFAPIGSSNVQSLSEFGVDKSLTAYQPLIVNVSISPGAYPLKISFVYLDDNNHTFTDDQVITLLVYRLPQLEINFYQEPGSLFTGQPNMLPLQVVNLGRSSVVLGNMRVNALSGQFSNNSILVGTLEPGGYFTLDASYIPDMPGTVDLSVSIDYTDDFNFMQVVTKTLTVDVMEMPIIEPPSDGGIPTDGGVTPQQPETFLQKVLRFIRGLFGLDSGVSSTPATSDGIQKGTPVHQDQPIIVPPLKGP